MRSQVQLHKYCAAALGSRLVVRLATCKVTLSKLISHLYRIKLCRDGISFPLDPSKGLTESLSALAKSQEYNDAILLLRARLLQEGKPKGSRSTGTGLERAIQQCDVGAILHDLQHSVSVEDNADGEELTEQSDDDPASSPNQRAHKRRMVEHNASSLSPLPQTQRGRPLLMFPGSQHLGPPSTLPVDPSHVFPTVPLATESLLPSPCTRARVQNDDNVRPARQSLQEVVSSGFEPQSRGESEDNTTGRRSLRSTSRRNLQSASQLQFIQTDSSKAGSQSAITEPFEHLCTSLQSLRQQLKTANQAERQAEQAMIEAQEEMAVYSRQIPGMAVDTPHTQGAPWDSRDHSTASTQEDVVNQVTERIDEINDVISKAQAFAKAREDFDNTHVGPNFFKCTRESVAALESAIRYHEQRKLTLQGYKTRLEELSAAVITAGCLREEKKEEAEKFKTLLMELKRSIVALDPDE